MFLDAQDWVHWYGQEHRVAGERERLCRLAARRRSTVIPCMKVAGERERLCRLAEQGNPDEGLAFRVGGWLIGLGRWLRGEAPPLR
jgi:hypothetical protein